MSDLSRLPALPPVTHLRRPPSLLPDVDGTAALAPTPCPTDRPEELPGTRPASLRIVPPLAPPTRTADAPLPPPPVALVLRGLLEVLSGLRPAAQLVPRTSPEIAGDLLARRRPRSVGRPPSVVRLRTHRVAHDVVEACAVIRREQRCGALAMRFEHGDRGWLLTRLEVG